MSSIVRLHDIPTWKLDSQRDNMLEAAEPMSNFQINGPMNQIMAEKVSLWAGDITRLKVDAIVNAANTTLKPRGGVDGAIHRAAGPSLRRECYHMHGCNIGEAKIANGYALPARRVIMTVGPKNGCAGCLKRCYVNSLRRAMSENLRTIAFPCISTGVFRYPREEASHIATFAVRQFLEEHADRFDRVVFCVYLLEDKLQYEQVLQTYFPAN